MQGEPLCQSLQNDLGRYLCTTTSKGDTSAGKAAAEGTVLTLPFHAELQLPTTPLLLGCLVRDPSTTHFGDFLSPSPHATSPDPVCVALAGMRCLPSPRPLHVPSINQRMLRMLLHWCRQDKDVWVARWHWAVMLRLPAPRAALRLALFCSPMSPLPFAIHTARADHAALIFILCCSISDGEQLFPADGLDTRDQSQNRSWQGRRV